MARARGERVGFVPTMGALHAGHATLVQAAAAELDCVVISIFVNPTQFNDQSDLKNYPRTEALDFEIAREAGATIAFAPPCEEIYPDGFATTVRPGAIAELLEGEHRPGHFDGMAPSSSPASSGSCAPMWRSSAARMPSSSRSSSSSCAISRSRRRSVAWRPSARPTAWP